MGVLHGAALFKGGSNFALSLTLSLAAGRIFDLTSLNLWDQWGQAGVQFRLTTSKGSVDTAPVDGQGGVAFHSYSPVLQGVSSVEISLVDRNLTFAPAVDDIVLSNITFVPRFSGSGNTLAVEQNGDAVDLGGLLHVTDVDSGQTLTWTQAGGPSHGTLVMADVNAAAGGADIAPGGTLTYRPDAGYVGTDTFTVQVSDGLAVSQKTITVNVAPQAPGMPALDPGSDTATEGDNVTAANTLTLTGTSGAGDSSSRVRVFVDIDGDGAFDAG
ncbi:Ig-like domain-containing protein [Pseudoduganella chitinolytica]|uniref:Ig-like domain-containing protein n=1 Tax=Pseudoduganella chitinolytica TaxID=34070 RepID=A0ABY8BGN6_9BURK|nr:Ig-like domain-containing protein [Pseudoduganella chitinolytica]WEF33459.1 Ig-like domain-containing protein [Pseudoduganella chitinolytica]